MKQQNYKKIKIIAYLSNVKIFCYFFVSIFSRSLKINTELNLSKIRMY